MYDLMAWLEASALGHAMRESGSWTYAIVNLAHILGVSALVLRRTPAWRARAVRDLSPREHRRLAWMGGLSLVCWLTAIAAGRFIGYW